MKKIVLIIKILICEQKVNLYSAICRICEKIMDSIETRRFQ